jgi:hypothetical protein
MLLAQECSHKGGAEAERSGARLVGRWLSHFAELGSEQACIDGPCPLEGLGVDGDVDQRIEPTDGANVARFGPFNAQVLGLAIDALTASPLGIDGLVERTVASQQGTHKPTGFQIDVLGACQKYHNLAKKGFYASGGELGDDMRQENCREKSFSGFGLALLHRYLLRFGPFARFQSAAYAFFPDSCAVESRRCFSERKVLYRTGRAT